MFVCHSWSATPGKSVTGGVCLCVLTAGGGNAPDTVVLESKGVIAIWVHYELAIEIRTAKLEKPAGVGGRSMWPGCEP